MNTDRPPSDRQAALDAIRRTVHVDKPQAPDPPPDTQYPLDPDDLLARLASDSALMAAWVSVREADLEDGHQSRAGRDFERNALTNLSRLRARLYAGSWRPGPVSRFQAPNEPARMLTVSALEDRIVERALADVLGPRIDRSLSPYCFAYRRGLGVRDAVTALRESMAGGATHVARADVRHAFDEIPRRRSIESLAACVPDQRVTDIVEHLLSRLDDDGLEGLGIPQGSAVSPILLNLYLAPLDLVLMDKGFVPIRYADDLAIPVDSEKEGWEVLSVVSEFLEQLALELNSQKCSVEAFASGVDFLGQRVGPLGTPDSADEHVHPRRMSLYVMGQGSLARLAAGHARVVRDGQTTASVSLNRLRQIVLGGRAHATTPLVREAARKGIEVFLLDDAGQYEGRISRRRGSDVRIRQAQFRAADDADLTLSIARQVVADKIANMRVLILRDLRRRGRSDQASKTRVARELQGWAHHALTAATHQSLMGIEGIAAKVYFAWLREVIPDEWEFQGRNRRPPRDPVNAMLSYCYTLLTGEVIAAVEIAGLDPDLGFLHSARWGRPALALDLVEPWRPVLADTTVLTLLRSGSISPDDFISDPASGCRMSHKARRALLVAYEKRMLTLAGSSRVRGKRAYRELLAEYARVLATHLVDPAEDYGSFEWR